MFEVKILIEGYARKIKKGWVASSTVTLVRSNNKNIIVDPGCNRDKLINALEKENLKVSDIDYVLLTHNHTDHTLISGIFERAKVLNTEEIYNGDVQTLHRNHIPETNLKIIQTPGHTQEHCSLIVPTKDGVYVVAGDVFWWMDGEKQKIDIRKEDQAHPADMKKLIKSRKKVLKIADYIIPGHGKMFRVNK